MKEVKRIFFLTKEETEVIKQEKQDIYIVYGMPCFELEGGEILYPKGKIL